MFIVSAGSERIPCSTRVEVNEVTRDLAHDLSLDGFRVAEPRAIPKLRIGASVTVAIARRRAASVEIRVQRILQ